MMQHDGTISGPKLVESGNSQRFAPTERYRCPQCGGPVLQDTWPPNRSGGVMTPVRTEAYGSIKHVCLTCRIAFKVKWVHRFERGKTQDRFDIADVVPLVERDGYLLTPHDVQRFKYFDEHGVWPKEAFT